MKIIKMDSKIEGQFTGMNSYAAEQLNIPFPFSKSTILVWKGLDSTEKRNVVEHERREIALMKTGMPYHRAHGRVIATMRRKLLPKHLYSIDRVPKRVLICGDRNWKDRSNIDSFIRTLPKSTIIIEGGASGADTLAKLCAKKRGMTVKEFKADWEKYGRAAGPIRNSRMLKKGRPQLVVAFHSNLQSSKGTRNMLIQAKAKHIPTKLIGKRRSYV